MTYIIKGNHYNFNTPPRMQEVARNVNSTETLPGSTASLLNVLDFSSFIGSDVSSDVPKSSKITLFCNVTGMTTLGFGEISFVTPLNIIQVIPQAPVTGGKFQIEILRTSLNTYIKFSSNCLKFNDGSSGSESSYILNHNTDGYNISKTADLDMYFGSEDNPVTWTVEEVLIEVYANNDY